MYAVFCNDIRITSPPQRDEMLDEALQVHVGGLEIAIAVFGEASLTVSKYYGNLGRLYQARQEFELV